MEILSTFLLYHHHHWLPWYGFRRNWETEWLLCLSIDDGWLLRCILSNRLIFLDSWIEVYYQIVLFIRMDGDDLWLFGFQRLIECKRRVILLFRFTIINLTRLRYLQIDQNLFQLRDLAIEHGSDHCRLLNVNLYELLFALLHALIVPFVFVWFDLGRNGIQ